MRDYCIGESLLLGKWRYGVQLVNRPLSSPFKRIGAEVGHKLLSEVSLLLSEPSHV